MGRTADKANGWVPMSGNRGAPAASPPRWQQIVAALGIVLLGAGAILCAFWGGTVVAGEFAPGAEAIFLPIGGVALVLAWVLATSTWRLAAWAGRVRRRRMPAALSAVVVGLPTLLGIGLTSARILASGVSLPTLLWQTIPTLFTLLLLLGVGGLVRAAAR